MPPPLPLELVQKVHDNLTREVDLARWRRVARVFLEPSRQRLYEAATLRLYSSFGGDDEHFYTADTLALLSTVVRNRSLGRLATSLSIEDGTGWVPWTEDSSGVQTSVTLAMKSALALFPKVRSISVMPLFEEACCRAILEVEGLDLDTLDLQRPEYEGWQVLQHHTEVQHLRFSFADEWPMYDGLPTTPIRHLRLRSLSVKSVADDIARDFLANLTRSSIPSITRLDLPLDLDVIPYPSSFPNLRELDLRGRLKLPDLDRLLTILPSCSSLQTLGLQVDATRETVERSTLFSSSASFLPSDLITLLAAPSPARLHTLFFANPPTNRSTKWPTNDDIEALQQECMKRGIQLSDDCKCSPAATIMTPRASSAYNKTSRTKTKDSKIHDQRETLYARREERVQESLAERVTELEQQLEAKREELRARDVVERELREAKKTMANEQKKEQQNIGKHILRLEEELKAAVDARNKEREESAARIAQLNSQLTKVVADAGHTDEPEKQLAVARGEVRIAKAELKTAVDTLATTTAKLEAARRDLANSKAEAQALKLSLDKSDTVKSPAGGAKRGKGATAAKSSASAVDAVELVERSIQTEQVKAAPPSSKADAARIAQLERDFEAQEALLRAAEAELEAAGAEADKSAQRLTKAREERNALKEKIGLLEEGNKVTADRHAAFLKALNLSPAAVDHLLASPDLQAVLSLSSYQNCSILEVLSDFLRSQKGGATSSHAHDDPAMDTASLMDDIASLENDISNLEENNSILEEENAALKKQLAQQPQGRASSATGSKSSSEVAALTAELSKLKSLQTADARELRSSKHLVDQLREDKARLTDEKQQLADEKKRAVEEKQRLATVRDAAEAARAAAVKELEALKATSAADARNLRAANSQLEQQKKDIAAYNKEKAELRKELERIGAEARTATQGLDKQREELKKLNPQVSALSDAINQREEAVKKAEVAYATLKARQEAEAQELVESMQLVEKLQKEKDRLKAQLEETSKAQAAAESARVEAETKASKELEVQRDRVTALEQALNARGSKILEVEQKLAKAEAELERATAASGTTTPTPAPAALFSSAQHTSSAASHGFSTAPAYPSPAPSFTAHPAFATPPHPGTPVPPPSADTQQLVAAMSRNFSSLKQQMEAAQAEHTALLLKLAGFA
ncbi:hypothetical protein JCM10213v2_006957 [Rhodosporidiobolus nylandii]